MKIIENFSCFTILPVDIDDVRDFILNLGTVDRIIFHSVNSESAVLRGLLYHTKDKPPYFQGERVTANIAYCVDLPIDHQRIIACKELLHILDVGGQIAATRPSVSRLVTEIVLPQSLGNDWAKLQKVTASDKLGVLMALAVLLPRDAIAELRPFYEKGEIGIEEIATLAQLPEPYVAFAMTDEWFSFVEKF